MKNLHVRQGFTLLELLVTISIAAILVAVAVPSMRDMQEKTAVRGHYKEMLTTMAFSRTEAISRSQPVALCPSNDGSSCSGGWEDGWIVFVDDDRSGTDGDIDTGEELLRVYDYNGTNDIFVVDPFDSFDDLDFLRWNHRGFADQEQSALVVVCGRNGDVNLARGIMISISGRAISTRDTNGNTVHDHFFESDGGTATGALQCTY